MWKNSIVLVAILHYGVYICTGHGSSAGNLYKSLNIHVFVMIIAILDFRVTSKAYFECYTENVHLEADE